MLNVKEQHVTQAHGFVQTWMQDGFFKIIFLECIQSAYIDTPLRLKFTENELDLLLIETCLVCRIILETSGA